MRPIARTWHTAVMQMAASKFTSGEVCRWGVLLSAWLLVADLASPQDLALGTKPALLVELTTTGLVVAGDLRQSFPPPLLAAAQSPEERRRLLERLAARHGWERFARNSAVAPVHVELSYLTDDAGRRIGHNVYSAFVAYADWATLKDQELMESMFGPSAEDGELAGLEPGQVPSEILQQVGIESPVEAGERYSTTVIPLMNRVSIRGTARIAHFESADCLTVAWQLAPQFNLDSGEPLVEAWQPYANRYVKIERDELGRILPSAPVPYAGCGGMLYVQATGLVDRQLLIESRTVLHEPAEWFAGSNFLRSRFPLVLQESAQKFRRRLAQGPP